MKDIKKILKDLLCILGGKDYSFENKLNKKKRIFMITPLLFCYSIERGMLYKKQFKQIYIQGVLKINSQTSAMGLVHKIENKF